MKNGSNYHQKIKGGLKYKKGRVNDMIMDFLILVWAVIYLVSGEIWKFIFTPASPQKQKFDYNEWAYRNYEIYHEPAPAIYSE